MQFDEVKGRILDLTVEICEGVFDEFCIELAHNQEYTTSYTYMKKTDMEVNDILRVTGTSYVSVRGNFQNKKNL